MLFGEKQLYHQTRALKRGEQKLPPLLENLRLRIAARLDIRVLNVVYDKIDLGPAKGTPRLNIIVDAQRDLSRIKENLFNLKSDAQSAILEEFNTTAMQAGWDCQRVHLISDDFSDEAMNQAVFQFFNKDGKRLVKQFSAHRIWDITGMSKHIVVFFKDEAAKADALSNRDGDQIRQACYSAVKPYDEFGYFTPENFSLVFDSKENLDNKYEGNLYYYFK